MNKTQEKAFNTMKALVEAGKEVPQGLADIACGLAPKTIRQPSGGKHYGFTRTLPKAILYDTLTFDGAAAGALRKYQFFAVPYDQPDPVTNVNKTEQETNLSEAYKLPAGESFKVLGMSWTPVSIDFTLDEFISLTYWSVLVMIIDRVEYAKIPFGYIGSGGGENIYLPPEGAGVFTDDYMLHSSPSGKNIYANEFGIIIPPNKEFRFELWVGASGASLANENQIKLYLHGTKKTPLAFTGNPR